MTEKNLVDLSTMVDGATVEVDGPGDKMRITLDGDINQETGKVTMGGRLTIRLPNWMRAKLDAAAAERGVTVSEVVKSALKERL